MKILGLALAASLIGSAALAQSSSTTVTRTDGPLGERTTVTKERSDDVVTMRRTESTGSLGGCDTKSVTRTNEFGDSQTKTKTDC